VIGRPVLGIDIGGTHVRVVLEDEGGREHARVRERVEHSTGPKAVLASVVEKTSALVGSAEVTAIGISVSGPVDVATGVVNNPWTLAGWRSLDVRAPFAHLARVVVENDANAAAVGEWARGAGRGFDPVAAVTVGTGVGVGLVVGGNIFRGAGGAHPEAGHRSIEADGPKCYCGCVGCWEQLASGPALVRASGRRPEDVLGDALSGDQASLEQLEELARRIGQGLREIRSLYAPGMIVLGGRLGSRLGPLRHAIVDGWGHRSTLAPRSELRFAALGDFSGAIGAAVCARRASLARLL
jgi:glucokinase